MPFRQRLSRTVRGIPEANFQDRHSPLPLPQVRSPALRFRLLTAPDPRPFFSSAFRALSVRSFSSYPYPLYFFHGNSPRPSGSSLVSFRSSQSHRRALLSRTNSRSGLSTSRIR